jgi:hypothetical protein
MSKSMAVTLPVVHDGPVTMEDPDEWERAVLAHFGFLLERGFHVTQREHKWWATTIVLEGEHVAVMVSHSREFNGVELELRRLVAGEVPPVEVFITPETPVNSVLGWRLLERAPRMVRLQRFIMRGLSPRAVERQLQFWADVLRTYGADILDGDLTLFGQHEAELQDNARRDPPVLTISLPADATAEDEERAVADAARVTPPGVKIVVQRYRRPR